MIKIICIGIESTAHTFGIGILKDKEILAEVRSSYKPPHGYGIHPIEAAKHHQECKERILQDAMDKASIKMDEVDTVAYSAGPGLPPCLKVGFEFAKSFGKPLLEVNHCIGHIEVARMLTGCKDPIILYVSGGNTQVIGYSKKRYRVLGETQDIAIGNAIDKFIIKTMGKYPGGPLMEDLGKSGKYVELPYVVKGMDLSFSGILTAALQKADRGNNINDLCFSFQETCYAMLCEVVERAMSYAGKNEAMITGGVSASKRLNEMLKIMCEERGAQFYSCPIKYSGDNGAMIAVAGMIAYENGQPIAKTPNFYQKWRTDQVDVSWI